MPFKMRSGNVTSFKKMGSSPIKWTGIFEGVGEDRVRISRSDAEKKIKAGATNITFTASDNPNIEEGKQQIKNLGIRYHNLDKELQEEKDVGYTPPKGIWRGTQESFDEGDEGIERVIRKREKGGDTEKSKSSTTTTTKGTYRINGKEVSKEEYDKIMVKFHEQEEKKKNK